jgi:hypothetical protein
MLILGQGRLSTLSSLSNFPKAAARRIALDPATAASSDQHAPDITESLDPRELGKSVAGSSPARAPRWD